MAWRLDYPSADITSLDVGQIAPTAAVSALHGSEARVRDERYLDATPAEAERAQPQPRRSYRMPQSGDSARTMTTEAGVEILRPDAFRWSPAPGNAPTGAPTWRTGDAASHLPYDRVAGLTGLDGSIAQPGDPAAHTTTPATDRDHPRQEMGGYAMAAGKHTASAEVVTDEPAAVVTTNARVPYDKPAAWYLGGRPATRPVHLFMRPFDQVFAHHMSGLRLPIAAPPTFGPGVSITPRASRPIMTQVEADVPGGDAYPGATFAAPGMRASRWINTLRTPPSPHDAALVDTGR